MAGPQGFVVYREIPAGEIPTFTPVDGQGRTLPDGVYAYELRAVDPAGGEGVLAGYLAVRDGSFVVMGGGGGTDPLTGKTGTSTPEAPLEVQGANSGLMMQLEGGGDVFFREKNGATGQFVDLNLIGNEFRINFGTGGAGPELRLTNTSNLILAGSGPPAITFRTTGTCPTSPVPARSSGTD